MPNDDKMNIAERRKYLRLMVPRYHKAKKAERSRLLTEMEMVTGLHRKSLIRLMSMSSLECSPRKPVARQRRYGRAVAEVVRVVWESLDYVCAERLTPVLQETARQLSRWGELRLTAEIEMALGSISRATVQRMIKHFQQHTPRLPRRRPQPPNRLLQDVPMERLSWRTEAPGSFETDLVHHCGAIAAGDYVHTLQLVDIATGWSEFFNAHLIRYFGDEITGLHLSRSRPYHKNDNRFVEQKNSTLVRAYVGYDRLDSGSQCPL